MLQTIHDKAKGWVAYIVIGLISIPFALVGVNSYLQGGGNVNAATVNGEDVPAVDVQNQLAQIRRQLGQFAASMGDEQLKQMALDNVVNQTLMRQKIAEQGYRASAQEVAAAIAGMDFLQTDGKFDMTKYQAFLQQQRRAQGEFERLMREDLTQGQFRQGVTGTAFVTRDEAGHYQALRNQQRELELFTLKATDFEGGISIPDDKVQAYYDQNKADYMTDQRVRLAYVDVDQSQLAAGIEASDEVLQGYYDEHASQYVTPESRTVSRILLSLEPPAREEEVKKKIDALYQAIQSGKKTFEEVAKAESDDKLSGAEGGDMGEDIVAGDWDPEFEKVVFSLEADTLSEPFLSGSGYELVRVNTIKPARQKHFEEARAQLESDYRNAQAEELFIDKAESLQTIAYEQSGDLAPAAQAAGLPVQQSDWITAAQGDGIAANPKVRAAAFSEAVLQERRNSEAIELAPSHVVFLRVLEEEAAKQKPLDEVKAEIIQTLTRQEARMAAADEGKKLLASLEQGNDWAALAAASPALNVDAVEKLGKIGRSGNQLDPAIVSAAFSMAHPQDGVTVWSNAVLGNGDYVIIALKAVEAGSSEVTDQVMSTYSSQLGNRELGASLKALRESADIELMPNNI
ncbi:MAG: SurA N-terminal domain-containing protein [Thiothrix sp.]|nr:SurA N-terminal domain-containing protein [Thiothrix sp.]HPQ96834.1 SurA N-terminal domain-containing protein [Thiolinea sp.]